MNEKIAPTYPINIVKKENKLKNVTPEQIKVIAILEILEDTLWTSNVTYKGENVTVKKDTDGKTLDEIVTKWTDWIKYTESSDTWKDGHHCGDCTKVPMTCFRCLCESHLSIANKFINYFNNGEYTTY